MSKHTTTPAGGLTMAEAATIAGVHEATIRRAIAKKLITAYRVGPRLIRVDRDSFDAYLRGERVVGGRW